MLKNLRSVMFTSLAVIALIGCGKSAEVSTTDELAFSNPNTLTIIAGSEIEAIKPLIDEASNKLGFPIAIKYTGTIEGVEAVKEGQAYDIAWFGNSKYFYDTPESSRLIKTSEKIMFSPVIVGVRKESFAKNNLNANATYTWKDIAGWIKTEKLTYAMTDPSVSNSGYVALMGVVYTTANKGENISVNDVNKEVLQDFFKGQKVTAKSSNWLMDTFNKDTNIDFVINYESAILNNQTKLIPVYPSEGIITADYQMLLINDKKTEQYKSLVAFMKTKEVQEKLVNIYKYRPNNSDVMQTQNVFDPNKLLIEMPFNPNAELSEAILTSYFNEYKKPARFAFVIDKSGSMQGEREIEMKKMIDAFVNGSISKYATVRNREFIDIVPFSSEVEEIKTFDLATKEAMNNYIQNMPMEGGTAMYDGVLAAIKALIQDKKVNGDKYRYSIIVLTDGESNKGTNIDQFTNWYNENKLAQHDMRIFAISFGEADMNQLNGLTTLSGGKVFDGKKSLSSAFREIRSYQ